MSWNLPSQVHAPWAHLLFLLFGNRVLLSSKIEDAGGSQDQWVQVIKVITRVRKEIQVGCMEIDDNVSQVAVRDNFTKVGSA
jgi:hypothetical protein